MPAAQDSHYGNKSIPNGRTAYASTPQQTTVKTMPEPSAGQKPNRVNSDGNSRNIGNVGMTYQNVYLA